MGILDFFQQKPKTIEEMMDNPNPNNPQILQLESNFGNLLAAWIDLWFSFTLKFQKKPSAKELKEMKTAYLEQFMQAYSKYIVEFGALSRIPIAKPTNNQWETNNLAVSLMRKDSAGNPVFAVYDFKIKTIFHTPTEIEFQVWPKEAYSLTWYYLDGYAIYHTEEEIASKMQLSPTEGLNTLADFDAKGEPTILHFGGQLVRLKYLVKHRIQEAKQNPEMERFCFGGQSIFEFINHVRSVTTNNPHDKKWLKAVDKILKEEGIVK